MSLFVSREDGYYALTTGGIIAVTAVIAILIILTALLREREDGEEKKQKKGFSAKQLVFAAVALALGFIASYIKIIDMPWGGSATLCSMLFVTLIGYWYGPKIGLTAAFAYGFLQFIQGGGDYILSPLQVCVDYIFAFASLGLSGLFYKKPQGLIKGYILAIMIRGLFHSIGGYLYWMEYMPDSFPKSLTAIYPFVYNYSYILAEGVITIVILMLPPVKSAMTRVRKMAIE